ncbi:MAG: FG-GAP repeat protein, partial [Planctomycetales bacterium]|nr:FG-GAP repeat protein [Planctomycetales bacterium]
ADVDGDGKDDLVVGQFRNGNMQFFKNISQHGVPPKFAPAKWLMTDGERATVPGVW